MHTATDGISLPPDPPEHGWGHISRNPNIVNTIFSLTKLGKTQADIALTLGITQSAVCKVLSKYEFRDDLAVKRAKNLALPAVESLARAMKAGEAVGRHGAAQVILQAAGVLGTEGRDNGPKVVVQIGIQGGALTVQSGYAESDRPLSDSVASSLSNPIQSIAVSDSQ